jgi:hypothetical protein
MRINANVPVRYVGKVNSDLCLELAYLATIKLLIPWPLLNTYLGLHKCLTYKAKA